jgi:hypothetical protein
LDESWLFAEMISGASAGISFVFQRNSYYKLMMPETVVNNQALGKALMGKYTSLNLFPIPGWKIGKVSAY